MSPCCCLIVCSTNAPCVRPILVSLSAACNAFCCVFCLTRCQAAGERWGPGSSALVTCIRLGGLLRIAWAGSRGPARRETCRLSACARLAQSRLLRCAAQISSQPSFLPCAPLCWECALPRSELRPRLKRAT